LSFYLALILILFLQSAVLIGIFKSYLFVPDLLLCFLFLSNLRGQISYGKGFLSALLLDILQGSFGWHASGKLLALMVLDLLKKRFYIDNTPTLIMAYTVLALVEHTYRHILFSVKYYYPLEFYVMLAGFIAELLAVYYFGKRVIKSKDET